MSQITTQLESSIQGLDAQQETFFQVHGLGTLLLRPSMRVVHPYSWVGHLPFARVLVRLLSPHVLVELGTHTGNSFCSFCQTVKQDGLDTHCYAIDTWHGDIHAGHYGESVYRELSSYVGRNYGEFAELLRMTFDQALEKFPDGSIDLLHIDGVHTYAAVKHDFETWQHKLSSRGVVLFHDTRVADRNFGVNQLWAELRGQYPGFEFLHSHGLGVLLVGHEIPAALGEFIRLANAYPETTQAIFERASRMGLDGDAMKYQMRYGHVDTGEAMQPSLYCELFVDNGNGYTEDAKLIDQVRVKQGRARVVIELGEYAPGLVKLRFDPGVDAIALHSLRAQGCWQDGSWSPLNPTADNAIHHETGYVLFPSDPWVEYAIPREGLVAVEFELDVKAIGEGLSNELTEIMRHVYGALNKLEVTYSDIMRFKSELEEKERQQQAAALRQADLVRSLENIRIAEKNLVDHPLYKILTMLRMLPSIATTSGNK